MNTFLGLLAAFFFVLLTGCGEPVRTTEHSANLLGLKVVCMGNAKYYYGRVSDTTIVTPMIGADGRGVHCQEFGK